MCIKITDIQKKRAGDVTITSNCSPFTGQEETLALKKKKRKKNSTKPSDGHLHSHFALTQNNLIGRRKKKKKIVSDTPAKTNCSDIRFWSFLRAISDLHVG